MKLKQETHLRMILIYEQHWDHGKILQKCAVYKSTTGISQTDAYSKQWHELFK